MSVTPGLQEGIYYAHRDHPGNSFVILFVRARHPVYILKLRRTLSDLWKMYGKLKKGLVEDMKIEGKDRYRRTLTVLFGYGPKFFEIDGVARARPKDLSREWLFLNPGIGGAPVLPDTGLRYATSITNNEAADDHLAIQLIGDTQLATYRAAVETWKFFRKTEFDESLAPMIMRHFYTGFNRPDGRSWLGFHDGVSNVRSYERLDIILTNRRSVDTKDNWTVGGGTYMAFLRIGIDLDLWESIPVKEQERIVGRQKSTGCPLVAIDRYGNNLFASGCPVRGTRQITEEGNERFRLYDTRLRQAMLSKVSISGVENSHVGRMIKVPVQIFRQGYEFLESTQSYPYFRVGLNFVSFQGGTDKIYRSIKYGFDRVNFGGDPSNPLPGTDKLLSVYASGLFFVPPFNRMDSFPGDVIFDDKKKTSVYRENHNQKIHQT
jgi:Dyp-type peroxidase family